MEFTLNLFGHLFFLCLFYLFDAEYHSNTEGKLKPLFKTAVSEFSQYEVVKPTVYKNGRPFQPSQNKVDHPSEINIVIGTRQGQLTLVLTRNNKLFSKRYIEKTVASSNKYNLRRPHFNKLQNHCYYHGRVQGAAHSIVALSTCHGISGYIQYGKTVYHIEPAFDLDQQSHRLYNDVHSVNKPPNCGAHHDVHTIKRNETLEMEHKYDVFKRMKRSIPHSYDSNKNTRYVEMYIVNDLRTYESNGRDLDAQIRKTKNIINIVSRLYQPFNIYIALVGIENWTQQDMFIITSQADSTLENFLHYRRSVINPKHPNDNAQLITDTTFANGVVGKAIKGTICTFKYSGGVNLNLATPGQTATTIAHELGHNFGMDHDNYTVCQCKDDKCIMAATSGGINTPTQWSSCSMLALQEAFEMGMDYCLRNIPEQLYDGPVCGNGFTEDGEECDCGMPGACVSKCCNASTCKLTSGSICATGGCCDLSTCKPKEAATLCRASLGECDLPEYCWGDHPLCPTDVYLQDGTDCHNGQSYCFNGTCKTHTGQCKLLWGSTGRVSDPVCFKHLNTNGSKHGNCGYNWTTSRYEPCQRDDVMCGLLHCVHQNEKLMFWKDNLAHATPATFLTVGPTTYVCRGAILDVGLDMPDPGMVPDGAKCGDRKVCYKHKCMEMSHMRFGSCPAGCSDRGMCNSNGNCHCEEGWGGADCDSAGNGGSVDSGPIKMNDNNGLVVALVVIFIIIILFVVLGVLVYYFKENILAWWNKKVQKKHVEQSQPLRPVHPPPKRNSPTKAKPDGKPPPYDLVVGAQPIVINKSKSSSKPAATNRNQGLSVKISGPVLTGSTHKDSKSQVKASPVPNHKPPPPKLPQKPSQPPRYPTDSKPVNSQAARYQGDSKPVNNQSDKHVNAKSKGETDIESGNEGKSRFGDLFKMPSFSKSDRKGPKVEVKKQEELPAVDIVKKRELTRNISNPVLISTTDRRSKHLVNLESLNVNTSPAEERRASPPPPVPPHVSLNKNEYENIRRIRPLPPRPLSMPESECSDAPEVERLDSRKSAVMSSSPRMPERPPPPPMKPNVDNTRKMLEDELAKLDNINVEIPRDSPERIQTTVPLLPSNAKPKEIKPKPRATVSKSADANKKPMIPKTAAGKTKSETNKPIPHKPGDIQRPLFNPKARPGISNDSKGSKNSNSKQGNRSKGLQPPEPTRKPSTESMDDDQGSGEASVAGLAKRFEVQKKPLLADRSVKRTQSAVKAPMTPPKPRSGVKQIRSVDV